MQRQWSEQELGEHWPITHDEFDLLKQTCMVYVNTLMIQNVLSDSGWMNRMEIEDFRALTPLIYAHVNPYGSFELDMTSRLPVDFANELAA